MALYPLNTFTQVPSGIQLLPANTMATIPFQLAPGQRLDIDLTHAAGKERQDYALRCWISTLPGGDPNANAPLWLQTWQPAKPVNRVIVSFFDAATQTADTPYGHPAIPGSYFLNVLNLTNVHDQFSLTLTDTTATS